MRRKSRCRCLSGSAYRSRCRGAHAWNFSERPTRAPAGNIGNLKALFQVFPALGQRPCSACREALKRNGEPVEPLCSRDREGKTRIWTGQRVKPDGEPTNSGYTWYRLQPLKACEGNVLIRALKKRAIE